MAGPEASTGKIETGGGEIVRLLGVLGNEDRLRIICCLLSSTAGELNVTELLTRNGLKQSALSQNLAKMRESGIVAVRRTGHYKFYRISDAGVLVKILAAVHDYLR